MPHFVYDDTALFFPKTNLSPLPPGGDPTQYVQSSDWNTINQAAEDIKTLLRGAQWYGVEKQAVDPGPAGIADYLWADTGGSLYFHTGGGDVLLTPAAATVTGGLNVGAGVGSIGIFKQLSGGNLEFKGVRPASTKLSVVDAVGTDDIDIDVVEANVVHQNLSGAGASDHVAIDAQLPTTSQKTDLGQLDGAAEGTVWYSNASGRVTRLAPGTAGQFLQTAGAGAAPAWSATAVTVQDETVGVSNTPHTVFNFTGAGVAATDAGGGVVDITISGAGAGNNLDEAYTQGQTIDVDLAAVSMSNILNNANNVLELAKTPGAGVGGSCLVATMEDQADDWTAQFLHPGIGNVAGASSHGILVRNTTLSVTGAGNEEFSPIIALVAQAHDDTNDRTWTWALQNQTINAVAADESHLHFLVDDQGGGFVSAAFLTEIGLLHLLDNLEFELEINHTIDVATSTTADTAGGNLTVAAGGGLGTGAGGDLVLKGGDATTGTGNGGDIRVDAGNHVGGAEGAVYVGTTRASALSIGKAAVTTTLFGIVDLATSVSALDIQGGTALSIDGTQLTVAITATLLDEMLTFFGATDITGAQAETLTDGSNADALHVHAVVAHTIASHSDTTATGTELETLTDSSNADSLHVHSALSADSADISLTTTTSGDINLVSVAEVDIDGTAIQIDGTGDMNFTSTQAAAATALVMNIFADNNGITSGDTDLNIDANSASGTARVNINADAGGEINIASDAVTQTVTIGNATVSSVNIHGALLGIFGATAVAQQASGADLTNNVTSGGTNDQVDDFTDLSTYATDAAAIRNAIFQLTRKLKQVNDGLRAYGWLT